MADKAWKAFERRTARAFGVERNPRSGGDRTDDNDLTGSDSLHDVLWIDCKYTNPKSKVQNATVTEWMGVRDKAKKEKKTPVLVLGGGRITGRLIVVHERDLLRVAAEYAMAQRELLRQRILAEAQKEDEP